MNDKRNMQAESDLPKLGRPAERALAGAGILRLEQLTRFSENEIKQLHGVGPNALAKLRQALAAQGLSFAEKKKMKQETQGNILPEAELARKTFRQ